MKRVLQIACVALLLPLGAAWAQERTVTGRVTSAEDGSTLPGVNVIVKGTSVGTATDVEGKYSIQVNQADAVLIFSFIGLKTIERSVGSNTTIDVAMAADATTLEEVLVVAYGEQSQRAIVGSIANVDKEVIEKQQLTSVLTAIQGSVPGVNIIAAGGQPGDNPTIRIRGVASVNAAADPLIVVDGTPFNGNINTISPDQIESMNVLKDASSTALYGSRGSNGVILITTKKGKLKAPTSFNFTVTTGVAGQAVPMHDFLSTDQYMELGWEAMRNKRLYVDGDTPTDAAQFATDNLISDLFQYNPYTVANPVGTDGRLVSTDKIWDTDWMDEIVNNSAKRQEYALSVSGGSDNTSYFFSANYLDQEGSVQTGNFRRFSSRLNIDSRVNNWLSVGLNSFYSTQKQNYPTQSGSSYQSAIQWVYSVPSVYPLYRRDETGALILDNFGEPIYDYGNAIGQLLNGSRPVLSGENAVGALYYYQVRNMRDNFTANGYAKVDFTDYLSFKTNLAYERYMLDGFNYAHNEFGYAANVGGRVTNQRDLTTTLNFINTLNFSKSFGEHNLSATLVQEAYQFEISGLSAQGTGFLPNVYVLNGSTTPENVGGFVTEERLTSYLGRFSYNFSDKYYVEGSVRNDASSRFAEDVRKGTFYSVGAGWIATEEDFVRNLIGGNVLSFLKFRASYGELGNNRTNSYFPYLQLFNTGWNQGPFPGVLLGGVTDPFLQWEKTSSMNIGAEMQFFNNRIGVTVDYYNKKSIDLIFGKPLPPSTGNSQIVTNIGGLKNYGWEFSISSTNISKGAFQWTSGLNFSLDRNEITELTQESIIDGTKRWEVGRSLYEFWIQDWAGVDPADGYGMWYKDVLDGDGNPTGERETTKVYADATRYYSGKSSLPDVIGGLTNYVRYGNFDMNILFNFSFGGYVYDGQYAGIMDGFTSVGTASTDLLNRWQQPGDETDVPLLLNSNNDFNSQSTRFLFKNNYVRLKALNVGYNLPTSLIDKYGFSGVRVFFQADNLLTFQSHKGIDPEQSLAGTTNNRSYNQRIVSMGLNVKF